MRDSWPTLTGRPAKRWRKFWVVLAREQRRRRDDRDLLAVDRRGEGGAQRDLGLAEADVAAHQPVHRPAGGQIVERRLDRARLVRRLVIGKARAELVVETFGRGEARRRRASCAAAATRISSPAISRTRFFMRALRDCQPAPPSLSSSLGLRAVARQKLEIFDRQEQPVAAGIVDLEAIVRRARRLDRLQSDEAADAVVDMDDEIASGERARFGQNVLGAALALATGARAGRRECPARR